MSEDEDLLDNLRPFRTINDADFWKSSFPLDLMRVFLEELPLGDIAATTRWNVAEGCAMSLFNDSFWNQENDWEKFNLVLLRLTNGVTREDDLHGGRFLALHAAIDLMCHVGPTIPVSGSTFKHFLQLIEERDPVQSRMEDDSGSLPLHMAVN